jgi:cobaltochelatase CobN
MGFRPTEEQLNNMKLLVEKNIPLYVFIATSGEADLTTLTSKELKSVEKYFKNPTPENNKNFLNYTRKILNGKSWFTDEVVDAESYGKNYFFNPATDKTFEKLEDYEKFRKENNLYKKDAQKVLILCSNLLPSNPFTRDPYYKLTLELENRGLNVYPATGFSDRLKFIEEVKPDIIIYLPHGRLSAGQSKQVEELLGSVNVPVLGPQIVFQPYDKWMEDQMGLSGAMLGQNIIAPEFDGITTPYVIGAQFPNEEGLNVFKAIPERVEKFASLVENYLSLKTKPNKDKKLAIYYYKGPGLNSMSAEVFGKSPVVYPRLFKCLNKFNNDGVISNASAGIEFKPGPV